MDSDAPPKTEAEKIQGWRIESFEKMGFDGPDSIRLARSDVDLHRAARLLESGCLPSTAASILL